MLTDASAVSLVELPVGMYSGSKEKLRGNDVNGPEREATWGPKQWKLLMLCQQGVLGIELTLRKNIGFRCAFLGFGF